MLIVSEHLHREDISKTFPMHQFVEEEISALFSEASLIYFFNFTYHIH